MADKQQPTINKYFLSAAGAWNLGVWVGVAGIAVAVGIAHMGPNEEEKACYAALASTEKGRTGDYNFVYRKNAAVWQQKGCFLTPNDP